MLFIYPWISADEFLFANNQVESIITEAFNITVSDVAKIINNSFEHLQRQSFTRIRPAPGNLMSELKIINNDFHNFEPGFLQLSHDWDDSGLLTLVQINLHKACDCNLDLANAKKLNSSQDLENKLLNSSFCIGEGLSGKFISDLFHIYGN